MSMAPILEVIWRHLLVQTASGQRHYSRVADLASELGVGLSTAHLALGHPVEIGAVELSRRAGLTVLDPARLLTLYSAHRRLSRDVVYECHVDLSPENLEEHLVGQPGVILGGFRALLSHTGGINRIADYSTVLVYGEPDVDALPVTDDQTAATLLVARPDAWLANYGTITPASQAYADLFAMPGWQAARFVEETNQQELVTNDRLALLV